VQNASAPLRHKASRSLYALAVLLCVAATWAYLTPIDVAIWTRGVVRWDKDPVRVSSEAGGRVSRILIREGSLVSVGDVLVQLETRGLLRKRRALESRIHSLEFQAQALQQGASSDFMRGELAALYQDLQQTSLDLGRMTITSPTDGQVASVAVLHEGEILAVGAEVAKIVPSFAPLVVESFVSPSDRTHIREGQVAQLQRESASVNAKDSFTGTVVSISSRRKFEAASENHRVLIRPEFDAPELTPGATLSVHLIVGRKRLLWIIEGKIRSRNALLFGG
jgi:multidrug resistance efflux pump